MENSMKDLMSGTVDIKQIEERLNELRLTATTLSDYMQQLIDQQKDIEEHLLSVNGAIQALEALLPTPPSGP